MVDVIKYAIMNNRTLLFGTCNLNNYNLTLKILFKSNKQKQSLRTNINTELNIKIL